MAERVEIRATSFGCGAGEEVLQIDTHSEQRKGAILYSAKTDWGITPRRATIAFAPCQKPEISINVRYLRRSDLEQLFLDMQSSGQYEEKGVVKTYGGWTLMLPNIKNYLKIIIISVFDKKPLSSIHKNKQTFV